MSSSGKTSERPEVTVVGAGFSGLVAAWRLEKDGFRVTVLERAERSGGLIETRAHDFGLIETAANGLLASALVEELFSDCDVEIQVPRKSARRRYLAVSGQVSRFPLTLKETYHSFLKLLRVRKISPRPGETLESWSVRALGPAMAYKIIGPAMLGIYASQARDLSANLIVGKFYDRKRARNVRGVRTGTVSAPGGLGSLLVALRQKLETRGVVFRHQTTAQDVLNLGSGRMVLATSAWDAAEVLKRIRPSDSRIHALEKISPIPLISITVFFGQKPPRLGFGTLFAQASSPYESGLGESDGILGCLQNSEIFDGRAKPGVHSETWIVGGFTEGESRLTQSDDALLNSVLEKRDRWIDSQSQENMLGFQIARWPKAIPHYGIELEDVVDQLRETEGGITLFGNYLGDLGLASILESSRRLTDKVRESK